MSRTRSAFIGALSSQFAILLNFITTPFILHNLSANIYGLSIIIFQITSYLGMFDFGLTAGVERFLAGTRGDSEESRGKIQQIISTSFIVYLILGAMVVLVGCVFAPFAAEAFNVPADTVEDVSSIIVYLSVLVGLQFLLRAVSGIFFAHQKQLLSNSLSFILNISNALFTVYFVYLGFELWSFVYAQILVFFFNALLNFILFRRHYGYIKIRPSNFNLSLLKEMFAYGFYLFVIGIAVQIVFQTDRILIGSIVSLSAVSVYALTSKLPELASQFIWKITDNSFPAMVELSKGQDLNHFRMVHDKLMKLTLSLTTTAFWFISLATFPFLSLWVGPAFFAGQEFVFLICYLYLIQLTFIHVSAMCLNGAGIAKQLSLMSVVEATLNLGISIILAKQFGLIGVLLGTIISGILTSFWYVPYLTIRFMRIKLSSYLIGIIKPIIFCSAFDGTIYLLFKYFNLGSANMTWLSFTVTYTGVFIVMLIPTIIFNKDLLKDVLGKVTKTLI
jgi:O-antigen/teichoic acid export membrane protein